MFILHNDDGDLDDKDDGEIPAQMVKAASCMVSHSLKTLSLDCIDLISCYCSILRLPKRRVITGALRNQALPFINPILTSLWIWP